jgi:hypothetical protein
VELPEGSLLALYTDGLIESRQQDVGSGLERLSHELSGAQASPDTLCDEVVAALLPGRRTDDAALLLARVQRLDAGQVATWDVPADPAAVSGTRAHVIRQLSDWGCESAGCVTELVVSELVTNAIRYGSTPIQLRLADGKVIWCEQALPADM